MIDDLAICCIKMLHALVYLYDKRRLSREELIRHSEMKLTFLMDTKYSQRLFLPAGEIIKKYLAAISPSEPASSESKELQS